jgi:hypothetical protein
MAGEGALDMGRGDTMTHAEQAAEIAVSVFKSARSQHTPLDETWDERDMARTLALVSIAESGERITMMLANYFGDKDVAAEYE